MSVEQMGRQMKYEKIMVPRRVSEATRLNALPAAHKLGERELFNVI